MEQNSRQKEFRERFARHADELKWLYMELYHGDESAYHYFVEMLSRMYAARSASLRKLDRERLADPDWYKGHELVGMLMYVSAFAKNLQGVRKKLDYITECGVNCVHLMPLLKNGAEAVSGRIDEITAELAGVMARTGVNSLEKMDASIIHRRAF